MSDTFYFCPYCYSDFITKKEGFYFCFDCGRDFDDPIIEHVEYYNGMED